VMLHSGYDMSCPLGIYLEIHSSEFPYDALSSLVTLAN
jgi:hypothetical protein